MATVRWHDAAGGTATLIAAGATSLSTDTYFDDRLLYPTIDTDNDGTADAIIAGFDDPRTINPVAEYAVFYDDPAVANIPGRGYDGYLVAIDASLSSRLTRYGPERYIDLPVAYLGSSGRDVVTAAWGDSVVAGNGGNDTITTGAGRDLLRGGDGNDFLNGGANDDRLIGEAGHDRLTGGTGADVFVVGLGDVADRDVIADLSQAEGDRLDLSALTPGLTFLGDARLTGTGPEATLSFADGRTRLVFDLDGDRRPDGLIVLLGEHHLTADDLILPPATI